MRRILVLALGTTAALATAAVAVAAFTAAGVSATTATFAAGKVDKSTSRTCTGADGKTFEITNGRYTGSIDFADPNGDLDGPITIQARTTSDTTVSASKLGYVEGSFRSKDDNSHLAGKFWGTVDNNGHVVGFLQGQSRGRHAKVLGNLSATFAAATGFADGKLGSNSSTAVLAVVAGPVCKGPKPNKPAKADRPTKSDRHKKSDHAGRPVSVTGEVTSLTTAAPLTITVTPTKGEAKTCAVDGDSPSTALFPVGTKDVRMKCRWIGTPTQTLTLRELAKHT